MNTSLDIIDETENEQSSSDQNEVLMEVEDEEVNYEETNEEVNNYYYYYDVNELNELNEEDEINEENEETETDRDNNLSPTEDDLDNQGMSTEIETELNEGITAEINRFNNILSTYNTIFREQDISANLLNQIHPIYNQRSEPTEETPDFNLNRETTNAFTRLLQTSFYDKPKYKQIISEKGEEDLKVIEYNSSLNTNTICPIYQTEFTDGMQVIKLPCTHSFTPDAIRKWLKEERAECPVCRYELDSKEVEDESYTETMALLNRRGRRHALFPGSSRAPPRRASILDTPSSSLLINTILSPQALPAPQPSIVTTYPTYISEAPDFVNTIDTSNNVDINLEPLNPHLIRRRITTNFLADIVNEVVNTQQEEDLQQAILNSLQTTQDN